MERNEFVDYVAEMNPNYVDGFAKDLIRQARKIKREENESNTTEDTRHSVQDRCALQSS